MKTEQQRIEPAIKLHTYNESLKILFEIFGRAEQDCKFIETCICGFSSNIENCEIKSFTVIYDKIWFDIDGKSFLWPMQKHTCDLTIEQGQQLLEKLRKT